MSSILLIRHAQSEFTGRFCGSSDPPLSPVGVAEAQALAMRLRTTPISQIYCSPLRRALMTAEAIAATREVPPTMMDALREIDFGAWEGLTWSQIELRDRQYAQQWIDQFPNLPAPAGEPFEIFRQRVEQAFVQIQAAHDSGTVAIVAHSAVLGVIMAYASGKPFKSMPALANAAVCELSNK
jgi:alpha-ribazole phosphatase/probable phosphoglycerate mutase